MNARRVQVLALSALVVAGAAVWVSIRNAPQPAPAGGAALPGLADALDSVSEVRLARGDGVRATLSRRGEGGARWTVAERDYPVDAGKLRSLLLDLSALRTIEEKTSEPARYPLLDVQDATDAKSPSVRVDVAAGTRAWTVVLGKQAEPGASYARVPPAPAALLVRPGITADPAPAHWIAAELIDIGADRVREVGVRPAGSPAYTLAREHASGGSGAELALRAVPPGRKPAAGAVLNSATANLARLTAEDVQASPDKLPEHASHASFRTFDALVLDLDGYQDGARAWLRIKASAANGGTEPAEAAAINARLGGHDFEVASYKYDAIFKPLEALLQARAKR